MKIVDDLLVLENFLLVKFKNKSTKKIHLSDIKKAYIVSKRKSNNLKMMLLLVPVILLFFFDEYYLVFLLMVIIVLYLFTKSTIYNVKSKLIIELNSMEKIELKFKNDIKYKIIDTISLIRKTKS